MSERRLKPVLWGATGVLVLALVAFLAVGANSPADPSLAPTEEAPRPIDEARQPVDGFGEIGFGLLSAPDPGQPVDVPSVANERCALLAESDVQLSQGLMGRRDLSGYDGMIFRFANDTTSGFFMRNVPMPLEIAWFDSDGRLVSTAEMAPCPDTDGCQTYPPAGPFRFALEVEAGGLGRLGIQGDTVLVLGERCAVP